jgi:CBS domain-containing protein
MKVASVLRKKGKELYTVRAEQSMIDAVNLMVEKRIGALVVVDGLRPVSIVTERDVLRALPQYGAALDGVRVQALMAKRLVVCTSSDTVDHVMDLMNNNITGNRIRHLPVVDGDELVGMLSIGDVVDALLTEAKFENRLLKNFIKNWPEED